MDFIIDLIRIFMLIYYKGTGACSFDIGVEELIK